VPPRRRAKQHQPPDASRVGVKARALVRVDRALQCAVARGATSHKIRHMDAQRDREQGIVADGAPWSVPAPVEGVLTDGQHMGGDSPLGTAFPRQSRIESIRALLDSVESVTVYCPQVASACIATRR
jgi:hypothetical protein